jgi:hypothetical protein
MAESDLLGLHEGNFARYQLRPAEFAAWQEVWGGKRAIKTFMPERNLHRRELSL